ncbi:MAG: hypothetical protein KAR38_15830 [Calditrichia bacterium]|nr:hypothetical protein [Calditrichia bacterium]
MKHLNKLIVIAIVAVVLFTPAFAQAQKTTVNEVFSKNLVKALKSDNMGLKKSAMQLVIRYGDRLNVKDAAFDLMDVYRNHRNNRVRHLAMVAIYKMDYNRGVDFIVRNLKFEDHQPIKDMTYAIMLEMQQGKEAKDIAEEFALLD